MKLALVAVALLTAAPAAAQITVTPLGDPRASAERGYADAQARAAAAQAQSRQTELTTQNLRIDRTLPAQGGVRDAARGELDRERLEARQAEAVEAQRLRDAERLRLERLDPALAPRP